MSNLEYITQARKLLTEDYKSKHTDEYNNWLSKHQNSWMQPHIVVPFPPFIVSSSLAPFKPTVSEPSEEAVVAKALELYNQFNPAPVAKTATMVEPVVKSVVEETMVESVAEPVVKEVIIKPVVDPVVKEVIVEPVVIPVVEETIIEPVVETVVEPVVEKISKNVDTIYKIFQDPIIDEPTTTSATKPLPPTIEQALNIVPQPAEELSKIKNSGRILPSVLEKLQAMKDKWSTSGDKHV